MYELVQWPEISTKVNIKRDFEAFTGFQNIIGAVDGTHVVIEGIGKFRNGYKTRKCTYAINVTVVCDFNQKILFAAVGAPGSYHDNRVFEYTTLNNNTERHFEGEDVILGDSAYIESCTMAVPYINPSLPANVSFNYLHARGRVKVENTVGLLKCKYKIKGTTMRQKRLFTIVELVKSIICVHNFIVNYNQDNNIDDSQEDEGDMSSTNNEIV